MAGMSAGSLADRVVAVAGVGGGLGPLVAGRLAAEGAVVAGTDRSAETLAALPEDLQPMAQQVFTLIDSVFPDSWAVTSSAATTGLGPDS